MKILTIVGARPQFIKAAAVSRVIADDDDLNEVIVHTGQHYDADMSDIFFEQMGIPRPDHHLTVGSASHGVQTGAMLAKLDEILLTEKPDTVLVYGDTNSTLAGALCAAKLHIPIAHVEAGLRSFNRAMPEEINRVLTDHAADVLYTPTTLATQNLAKEGISGDNVVEVGDVMLDASLFYRQSNDVALESIVAGLSADAYILATVHRAENTDNPERLEAVIEGLVLATQRSKLDIVLPLHPRTRKAMRRALLETAANNLKLIDPVGFLQMLQLEANAALIATDSGGVQKEAYFFRVPCVTLRDETEWVELVEQGWNVVAPPASAESVAATIQARLGSTGKDVELYGGGNAAGRIVQDLRSRYGNPD